MGAALALAVTTAGLPGAAAGALAVRIVDVSRGHMPDAALPLAVVGGIVAPIAGMDVATCIVMYATFGLSAGLLWTTLRRRASGGMAALGGWLLGMGAPVALVAAASGIPDLSVVGFVAAGLAAFAERRVAAALLWSVVVASFDAHTGAIMGIAAGVMGAGPWAWFAAIALAGFPAAAISAGDAAPWAGGIGAAASVSGAFAAKAGEAPGVAAAPRGWILALVVVTVCAFGPVVQLGGHAVALPAFLVAAFELRGGWHGASVVLAAVAAVGLVRSPARSALVVGTVAVVAGASIAGWPPPSRALVVPLAVASLSERKGTILDLPFEVEGEPCAAPTGTNAAWRYFGALHGRVLATGDGPVSRTSGLLGEPAVVAALDIRCGSRYLVPPGLPGVALAALGVTEIAVHRERYLDETLAVLDPIFSRLYGPPRRDHAGSVDLYHVSRRAAAAQITGGLHLSGDPAVASWQTLDAFLAGTLPASTRADRPAPR